MYALHFYAATHYQSLISKGDRALQQGVPIMLSEWGTVSATGDGRLDFNNSGTWMDWADRNNISWFNWSWSVRRESSASIANGNLAGPWKYPNDLTQSGQWVYNRIKSWNTPKPINNQTPTSHPGGGGLCSLRGDGNNDGVVNIVDALLAARLYVGASAQIHNNKCLDVNCDNSVTIVDALLIARYYVRAISNFNC